MGLFNLEPVDTTPGVLEPFAPPAGWEGGRDDYLALLRQRFKRFEYRQAFVTAALVAQRDELRVVGPYADIARTAITRLAERTS